MNFGKSSVSKKISPRRGKKIRKKVAFTVVRLLLIALLVLIISGAVAGAAAMAVLSLPINYFISYPAYVKFYGLPLDVIISMYQAILPSADTLLKCLVIFNMPFTLVKGLIDVVLCFMIYKPLSPILHGRKH